MTTDLQDPRLRDESDKAIAACISAARYTAIVGVTSLAIAVLLLCQHFLDNTWEAEQGRLEWTPILIVAGVVYALPGVLCLIAARGINNRRFWGAVAALIFVPIVIVVMLGSVLISWLALSELPKDAIPQLCLEVVVLALCVASLMKVARLLKRFHSLPPKPQFRLRTWEAA